MLFSLYKKYNYLPLTPDFCFFNLFRTYDLQHSYFFLTLLQFCQKYKQKKQPDIFVLQPLTNIFYVFHLDSSTEISIKLILIIQ